MDEMLFHFSLVFDKWITIPTPPSEPMDGSVVTGCTTPVFHPAPGRVAPLCYTGIPMYHGCPYRQFRLGRYKVHVDILAHPTDTTMMAWSTTARGNDLDDTLERAGHRAITEFCERHLSVLSDTTIVLLPVRNEGNTVWCEHVATVGDPGLLTHHADWALMARYSQHVSS
jgi:hypothetical protein